MSKVWQTLLSIGALAFVAFLVWLAFQAFKTPGW